MTYIFMTSWKLKEVVLVRLLVTPWTVVLQGQGISQARILEWVAISFFRGIFLTQGMNLYLLH